jgi:hypothetical protein
MWKKIPDSLPVGFVSGIVSLCLFYFLLSSIKMLVINYYENYYLFQAPKVHLFSIFLNVLLFRFVIVKTDKEKLGKGILLATVSFSFVYFYYFLKFHQSIIGS